MSRDLGLRRLRGRNRSVLLAASVTVLSMTAGGCVVVHGEREVRPATTADEAAKALQDFTTAYNRADKAYDGFLEAEYTTGALDDIDAARLKAGSTNTPKGNPRHTPRELSDARFISPQMAGWPRRLVDDAAGEKCGQNRWLRVIT